MKLEVDVQPGLLLLRLEKGQKRLAYSVVTAINKTAKRAQRAQRARVRKRFQVRRSKFIEREAAIIKPFASVKKGVAFAEISVGRKPRLLLSTFEAGGPRKPVKGVRAAVPIIGGPARPSWAASVPTQYRFTKLKFRRAKRAGAKRAKKGSKPRFVGALGTYIVPAVGVFQREPGQEKAKLIYVFKAGLKIPATLGFVATVRRITNRWFKAELEAQVRDVLSRRGLSR